jgi:hypothetical protein
MNFQVVDDADTGKFFAPAPSDMIDGLLGQHAFMRRKIERVAEVMNSPDLDGALHYFAEHAGSYDRHISSHTVQNLFDLDGAIAYLHAAFWSKAMHLTDVLDVMPQARRDAWHKQIRAPLGERHDRTKEWITEPIPEFNDENVRSTLTALLTQRQTFFAERVDGIFRTLSKTHVTNAPEGFGRRMIIANVFSEWGGADHSRSGTINDLRCIIAKYMGRDEPKYDATSSVLKYARDYHRGEWVSIDGGALRIRCYGVGTAHLEVHPDMAWRLNCVLAQLYPLAIPSEFRERPKKKLKQFQMMGRPLPFAVLGRLQGLCPAQDLNPDRGWRTNSYISVPGCYDIRQNGGSPSDAVVAEANRVLQALGGTQVSPSRWAFDYDPMEAVKEIVASGCIPDQKAHQYYPTPEKLARIAVDLAEIGCNNTVLEPSAGTGGLADLLPKYRTTCVEISKLHCKVLESKGHMVATGDFLAWANTTAARFDRIVMNPPFSDGRWQAHTEHAASMLRPEGRLVAILPASARKSFNLPGLTCEWHGPYDNEFAGTSVSVCILVASNN